MNELKLPPTCNKQPHSLTIHNDERTDNYYWLNDRENPKVIEYLKDENEYTLYALRSTEKLQKDLYKELKSRIKKDDSSVPYEWHGYTYWRKFKNKED